MTITSSNGSTGVVWLSGYRSKSWRTAVEFLTAVARLREYCIDCCYFACEAGSPTDTAGYFTFG